MTKRFGKRSAAGLVNAILRKTTRDPLDSLLPADMEQSERRQILLSHPAWLLDRWTRHHGAERAEAIARLNNQPPPLFVRLPPGVTVEQGQACRFVRDCRDLTGVPGALAAQPPSEARPSGSASPGAGNRGTRSLTVAPRTEVVLGYPIQDEASQIVPHLLEPLAGRRVLDLCAAPGIKTGEIRELAPGARLVACDFYPARLRLLNELLAGAGPVDCVALDGTRPLPFNVKFDRILVDAPCSGTGTIRRNPEIKWRLKAVDLPILAAKQRWLLSNALDWLAPGGRLVYSTCSIEPEENQEVVEEVLKGRNDCRLKPVEEVTGEFLTLAGQLLLRGRFFQTLPDQGLDGFFAAVIEKYARRIG